VWDRAYATFEIKSFSDADRVIEGIASTPELDRRGDVLECEGASFTLPIPLLWQHKTDQPVGEVFEAHVSPAGIAIRARFAQVDEPGTLRDRLNEAWQSVKTKLVRGLSVGFKPIELVPIKKGDPFGGFRIKRWLWAELSAVTIPVNVAATITAIKSAAIGDTLPGDAGLPFVRARIAPSMKQTTAEQITAFETTRATKSARMVDLMTLDPGVTLDAKGIEEYDTLKAELKSIDDHLGRLHDLEALNLAQAKPIPPTPAAPAPPPVIAVKSLVPKGTTFIRYAMALVNGRGDSMRAIEFAKQWKDSTPEVELMVKAAVAPGDTVTPAWAGVLVDFKNATDEFLELLRPATILGKVTGLRQAPFMTQVPIQTGGGTYGWVGEGAPKPVGKLALSTVALQFSKAAGIIVITQELARLSQPSAEKLVRDDMIAGMAAFLDLQFIDPAVAAIANVSPASITNGAATAISTTDPFGDLHAIASYFATNQISLAGLTVIMSEANALTMGMYRDAGGARLFPGMTAAGGAAEGLTVIASNAAGSNVIGLQPSGILYADEGGVNIDVSREASVIMDSAPPAVPDATAVFTSFWQNNLIGLRAERMINWLRARPNSVYYLTGATYTPGP
jgi:HK97 family phage major capsid protein/HK97 family phage prohead protease